ncbi:hypothetical protein [Nocardioides sp.]|uniref:hypothetical protein n=1 Tax=Nocardioides sp. TaxID=35761 RepID=UPI002CDB4B1F|nr:hypothetical protein [Nocardioides sp.]HSX67386.1 hypothetical protein [Nocardioides sp.]
MTIRRVPDAGDSRLTCACHAELRDLAALLEERHGSGRLAIASADEDWRVPA